MAGLRDGTGAAAMAAPKFTRFGANVEVLVTVGVWERVVETGWALIVDTGTVLGRSRTGDGEIWHDEDGREMIG